MLFNSYTFIFFFLPVILTVWWWPGLNRSHRLALLTIGSYVFYGWAEWWYCLLMLGSTVVDYLAGQHLAPDKPASKRKRWLLLSLVANLGLLAVFKYAGLLTQSVNAVAQLFTSGGPELLEVPDIILPVGISFYTFQSMSYTIDRFRGRVPEARSFLEFAAYVSMFPQLIAGPIVRYSAIQEQLQTIPTRLSSSKVALGLHFFVFGLSKKLLVADPIARAIDPLLKNWEWMGFGEAWLSMTGYSLQIYFDFSGYSDMAVGLGLWLGFQLPRNFNSPYKALGPADFWRRWHITLSEWLRDYLYIPLGGNRKGLSSTSANILITMLLGGLWHGPSWTFAAWGLYHGLLLAVEHPLRSLRMKQPPKQLIRLFTLIAVVMGWVLFRADSFSMAIHLWWVMVGGQGIAFVPDSQPFLLVLAVVGLMWCWMAPNTWENTVSFSRRRAAILAFLFLACVLVMTRPSPFLYFRF